MDSLTVSSPTGHQERFSQPALWFGLIAVIVFCGECLGYAACALSGTLPVVAGAVVAAAGVAIMVAGFTAVLLNRLLLDNHRRMAVELSALREGVAGHQQLVTETAGQAELQRRLRHDLRGALSPALLTADRLLAHDDSKVRRAGEIMVKSIDRASALLADPAEASLPGDP